MSEVVFSRNYFNIPTTVTGYAEPKSGYIPALTSKGDIYIPKMQVSDRNNLINTCSNL